MQFLKIQNSTTLSDLSDMVGDKNVSNVLSLNGLKREKYIGRQFKEKCKNVIDTSEPIGWERQSSILSKYSSDAEIFEEAAIQGQSGWKVLANVGTFQNALAMPDNVVLPNSTDIIGNGKPLSKNIQEKAMDQLYTAPHYIDPSIFDDYSPVRNTLSVSGSPRTSSNIFEMFKIPWGKITLYDSISATSIDFPVYPESVQDSRKANYTTMQDILYQYEPWQIYTGSGPRSNSYTFHFHRQMWTGNELDGKANELIRFCEACLYPEFKGSAVNTSTVRLYVEGNTLISGIMSDVAVQWDGPIGQDGWYLECTLEITITEVAEQVLSHDVVKNLKIIG